MVDFSFGFFGGRDRSANGWPTSATLAGHVQYEIEIQVRNGCIIFTRKEEKGFVLTI